MKFLESFAATVPYLLLLAFLWWSFTRPEAQLAGLLGSRFNG